MPRTRGRVAIAAAVVAMAGPLLATPAVADTQNHRHDDGRVVSAYFADWDVYGRGYNVKDIPADKINVIQYAFAAPTFDKATGAVGCSILDPWADYQRPIDASLSVDGVGDVAGQPLFGNFNQILKLKKAHPGLKVEISLGGWTKSTWFADVAATAQRRQDFVKSCVDTFVNGNIPGLAPGAARGVFDGIDIDWEYPTQLAGGNVDYGPADKHNATLLMQEFRRQLGPDHLLTAALPATAKAGQYWELPAAVAPMSWVNVMTYDYNVPSGGVAAPDTLWSAFRSTATNTCGPATCTPSPTTAGRTRTAWPGTPSPSRRTTISLTRLRLSVATGTRGTGTLRPVSPGCSTPPARTTCARRSTPTGPAPRLTWQPFRR
jgi:chitinase